MHNNVCTHCSANKSDKPYWDMRSNALWRSTEVGGAEAGKLMSGPLTGLTGFTGDIVWPDVLHCLYWGSARDAVSSILIMLCLCLYVFGRGTIEWALEQAGLEWDEYCKRIKYKSGIGHFNRKTLGYTKRKSAPQIKCKAMDVKVMVGWLSEKLCGMANAYEESPEFGLAQGCVFWLNMFINVLEVADLILTPRQCQVAIKAGENYAMFYSALRKWANGVRLKLFLQRPKFHKFLHRVVQRLKKCRINPRYFDCFGDENLIGIVCNVAKICHPLAVGKSCIARWQAWCAEKWRHAEGEQ